MADGRRTRNERLADALAHLKAHQVDGIVRTASLRKADRVLLVKSGYLQEIIQGWYHFSNPGLAPGSTQWFVHFWPFVAQYLESRFGDDYCLSVETSLRLNAGLTIIPEQVTVIVTRPDNNLVSLPHGRSIFAMKLAGGLPRDKVRLNGVWGMTLEASLAQAPASFFARDPEIAAAALTLAEPSEVLRHLLDRESTVFAGRVVGAYTHLGGTETAESILRTMRDLGFSVTPSNPFNRPVPMSGGSRTRSPYVARLRTMWASMREDVARIFPSPPSGPVDIEAYLRNVDDVFKSDAYNSLSIEGYVVDDDLIERVRHGQYDPEVVESDKRQRDALAARGYYEAFGLVRAAIGRTIHGEDAAKIFRAAHRDWNYAMCAPEIRAGVMKPSGAVGYRNNVVMILGSEHVPPPFEAVVDCMEALFDLLDAEPHPAVRALLGHFVFGFVHPYPDRNGRLARFAMNLMLAGGGYPWTVVKVAERRRYMDALEEASCRGDIKPFTAFIADQMAGA